MPRKNILVVDDEKAQREILELILSEEGYDVTTAASGEAALKFAKDRRFDLALTDLKMTGMDGLAVMKTLRTKPETQPLPVLMLTAMTDEPSTRAGFEAGVTDYVTKPFSIPQLTARVRACLARTQLL